MINLKITQVKNDRQSIKMVNATLFLYIMVPPKVQQKECVQTKRVCV